MGLGESWSCFLTDASNRLFWLEAHHVARIACEGTLASPHADVLDVRGVHDSVRD